MAKSAAKREKTPQDGEWHLASNGSRLSPAALKPGHTGRSNPPASPIEGRTDHGERTSAPNRANVRRLWDAGVAGPRHHGRSAPPSGCDDRLVHAERRSSPLMGRDCRFIPLLPSRPAAIANLTAPVRGRACTVNGCVPPQVRASHATPRIALARMTASRSDNIRSSTGGCMTRCHIMGGTHRQLAPRCGHALDRPWRGLLIFAANAALPPLTRGWAAPLPAPGAAKRWGMSIAS